MSFLSPAVMSRFKPGCGRSLRRFLVVCWWSGIFAVASAAESAVLERAVELHAALSYAGNDNPIQSLDLYLPKDRRPGRRLPLVIFIHGGGWQNGSKATGKSWLHPYVASGNYAGASLGYRLAGEAPWPAQVHDCKAAVRWLRAHADQYGLDSDRFGVAGSSAGATLAVLVGANGDATDLEGEVGPHLDESSRVSAVLNLFARTNFLAEPDSARSGAKQAAALNTRLALLFGGTLVEKEALARAASPVNRIARGYPPVLTLHGTNDETVPFVQATELDAALARAGVSHQLIPVVGAGHGFKNAEADRRARQFFDHYLRGEATEPDPSPITAANRK